MSLSNYTTPTHRLLACQTKLQFDRKRAIDMHRTILIAYYKCWPAKKVMFTSVQQGLCVGWESSFFPSYEYIRTDGLFNIVRPIKVEAMIFPR